MVAAGAHAADPTPQTRVQQVQVNGDAEGADRKRSSAHLIVPREDLLRFADTNLADVLRRVPGIVIVPGGSRSAEIRLRGLGAGYTQILVNGEPVGPSFTIDSISPDLVERVEILRTASADTSAQAIAGSINIVLRRAPRMKGQRELKLTASGYDGLASGASSLQLSDRSGGLTYAIGANIGTDRDRWPSTGHHRADVHGEPLFTRSMQTLEEAHRTVVGLTPRLTWKPSDAQTLALDGLLQMQRLVVHGTDARHVQHGLAPDFASDRIGTRNDVLQGRLSTSWKAPLGEGRIEVRTTVTAVRRDSGSRLDAFDARSAPILTRRVESRLLDRSLALIGKYQVGLTDDHALAAGWDAQAVRRSEDRIQRESSELDYPVLDRDERYRAVVPRLALFVQDEWSINNHLSGHAGVRWEALHSDTNGTNLPAVKQRSSVWSPTLQLVWRLPGTKADKLRISMARTYKAPTARELIPRRWVVPDNSPTTPDFQGNPRLAPEIAWGLDAGLEHQGTNGISLTLNAYARRINDTILQVVSFGPDGRWISTPLNQGRSQVFGLELEGRRRLPSPWIGAPDIDLRGGLTRNASRVLNVPGPGNRLAQQPLLTATLGADVRLTGGWTAGIGFSYEKGHLARVSAAQAVHSPTRRQLDLYALWAVSKDAKLRLSIANVLHDDAVTTVLYEDPDFQQVQRTWARTFTSIRVAFEWRF